jgi:hypothetical protein
MEAMNNKPLPKILISAVPDGDYLMGSAVAEDGTILCEKTCSSVDWVRADFGLRSEHPRADFIQDAYRAHYPNGYELCDCIDCGAWHNAAPVSEHDALQRAIELIYDLRGYTHEWDWKYGAMWDLEIALIKRAAR